MAFYSYSRLSLPLAVNTKLHSDCFPSAKRPKDKKVAEYVFEAEVPAMLLVRLSDPDLYRHRVRLRLRDGQKGIKVHQRQTVIYMWIDCREN